MKINEISTVGESVIRDKGSILIGLSIKNSYFKDENLKKVLEWSSDHSNDSYIMIPDKPAVYTLMSLGYEEGRAKTKARLEANRLRNKCERIIDESKLSNISIITWDDIEGNRDYANSLAKIEHSYETDPALKPM